VLPLSKWLSVDKAPLLWPGFRCGTRELLDTASVMRYITDAICMVAHQNRLGSRFKAFAPLLVLYFRILLSFLMAGMGCSPSMTQAQTPAVQSFPETGFSANEEFLQFFAAYGGSDVFGPPISGELLEDGVRVQYFRNARLELHPENPYSYRIQPGLLGDLLGESQPPLSPLDVPLAGLSEQRYYPQTGHTVKYGFLLFFDLHGGIDLFGYPISEMMFEPGGRVVQWFQKARLEWCMDETGGKIQLAPLGERIFAARYPARAVSSVTTGKSDQASGLGADASATPDLTNGSGAEP